jgi:hypothetical protein
MKHAKPNSTPWGATWQIAGTYHPLRPPADPYSATQAPDQETTRLSFAGVEVAGDVAVGRGHRIFDGLEPVEPLRAIIADCPWREVDAVAAVLALHLGVGAAAGAASGPAGRCGCCSRRCRSSRVPWTRRRKPSNTTPATVPEGDASNTNRTSSCVMSALSCPPAR